MGKPTLIALALNVGSSSLKAALFDSTTGNLEEVDRFTAMDSDGDTVKQVFNWIATSGHSLPDITGHRIVHGGSRFSTPVVIDDEVLRELHQLEPLAPLHLPKALDVIEQAKELRLSVSHIACFDTAFHRTLPRIAWDLSLPTSLRDAGIRKYGFHGLNCEHIVDIVDQNALQKAVIVHLGSGCSVTAVDNGTSVDTSMSFTPSGGFPMATRSGDIDPGVVLYLLRQGHDVTQIDQIINHGSGLRGWSSEESNDMAELLESSTEDAAFAIDAFCTHVAKSIMQMAVSLGGLKTVIFTGGIGEHAEAVRNNVLNNLSFFGDLQMLVIPANEERIIAKHALDLARQMLDQ
jgi:acetate kinase